MKKRIFSAVLAVMLVFCLAVTAFGDYSEDYFYYTIDNQSVTITGCFGRQEELTVPSMIAGYPVNHIATGAFTGNKYLKTVNLPDTIMTIEEGAFDPSITVNMAASDIGIETTEPTAEPTAETDDEQTETPVTSPKVTPTAAPSATSTASPSETAASTPTPESTPYAVVLQDGENLEVTIVDDSLSELEEAQEEFEEEPVIMAAADGSEAESPAPEADEPAREQAEESSSSPAPFIIIGVLAAAVIAAAVIILKKKKQ